MWSQQIKASAAAALTMLLYCCSRVAPVAMAQDAPSQAPQRIEAQIEALSEKPGVTRVAGAALEHARLALMRAQQLRARGLRDAARRAERIARAATVLADRRLTRHAELVRLKKAERRAHRAQVRAARATQALEAARREKAHLGDGL